MRRAHGAMRRAQPAGRTRIRATASQQHRRRARHPAGHCRAGLQPAERRGGVAQRRLEVLASASSVSGSLFSSAFRVVFSATGYRDGTVKAVNLLNVLPDGCERSPILLCQSSAAAFGKRLDAQLRAQRAGGAPTSGTRELAFLLPQTVAAVSAGGVTRKGSVDVERAVAPTSRARARGSDR